MIKHTPQWKYYHANPERMLTLHRNRQKSIRHQLVILLNPEQKCVRCGFNDLRALQIDHKNGRGTEEYKGVKNNILKMYRFYLKNPELAKESLQVLCANCNWIKKSENREHPRL